MSPSNHESRRALIFSSTSTLIWIGACLVVIERRVSMADTEVKVKTAPEKEVSSVSAWPGFETSLFGRNFFEMSPFAVMRRFTEEMDRFFNGKTTASGGFWAPTVEVKEEGGKLFIMAELPG